MTSIILSPHFDDAVLSLGGLLAGKTGQVIVATLFAGTPASPVRSPWDRYCGFRDSSHAMHVRVQENEKSLSTCGIAKADIRNYAHLEHQYRSAAATQANADSSLEQMMRDDICALLDECSGTRVRVFAPGLEVHPDHALVKRAMLDVRSVAVGSNVDFFLYQDLPYAFAVLAGGRRKLAHLEAEMSQGTQSLRRQVVLLSTQDLDTKLDAVKHHASQIKALTVDTRLRTALPELSGQDLSDILKEYSAMQARFVGLPGRYCEIVYRIA
jgi:LmbE family N-acetylglucosaminyl deacetylase